MTCPACNRPAFPGDRCCRSCGASLSVTAGNNVSAGGGDINGSVYQAGRDVVVNHAPNVSPPAQYKPEPLWRSPVTQGALTWAGVLLGIVSLFPTWEFSQALCGLVRAIFAPSAERVEQYGRNMVLSFCPLAIILLLLLLVWFLRRLAKRQLRVPLRWNFALSGAGRRITLEKIRANCPDCGGEMRYYNKETRGYDYRDEKGVRRHKVLERRPHLECKRNSDHCFRVDSAEWKEE